MLDVENFEAAARETCPCRAIKVLSGSSSPTIFLPTYPLEELSDSWSTSEVILTHESGRFRKIRIKCKLFDIFFQFFFLSQTETYIKEENRSFRS